MRANVTKRILWALAIIFSATAWAGPTQSSFTPTAYKYPITKISLFKSDYSGEQVLYQCTGATAADCLVDVTSPASIQAIEDASASIQLDPGEYAYLSLQSCPVGSTGADTMNVQVMGSVMIGEQNFNTNEEATGGMSADGTPELATIAFGCGGANVKLTTPLTVAAGSQQTLTLLVDLTHVTWTDGNIPVSGGMGGCRGGGSGNQGLCTAFPFIVPFVGSGSPTFERYLVSHLAAEGTPAIEDANAEVNFAIDPAGTVFYVGAHPYYSESSPSEYDENKGGPDYNASTRTLSTNSDGSIAFQTGGDATDNRVGFTAFQRATHTATCKNEGSTSPTWTYRAFLQ